MRVLLDLKVLLDVVLRREPFYPASLSVLNRAAQGRFEGLIAGHAVTPLFYLTRRYASREVAEAALHELLRFVEVAAVGRPEIMSARTLAMPDFEDAVSAAAAAHAGCEAIVTRNLADFRASPVEAISPNELLERL